MTFKDLGLLPHFIQVAAQNGYEAPYPIQIEAIPAVLAGKDILGIAQTGSGKTASFALPILQQFQQWKPAKNRHISALVLVPTRELAVQVGEVFKLFRFLYKKYLKFRLMNKLIPSCAWFKIFSHISM